MMIEPVKKEIASFIVKGFSVRTNNQDEMNPKSAKLPALWQRFFASELANTTSIFGVYSDYESNEDGLYTVTAGVSQEANTDNLNTVTVLSGSYLVFEAKGPMPATVINVWKSIWEFFAANHQFQRKFATDFELYLGAEQIAVHIGVFS
ncbi:GyrI-like domain-containing protein [Legionella genomosp. 1]|uniref:GyrI-like domain-containing protein n=1 Tax=Legionella genomosp. 1 TaxID=1093625 RepID=UPI001056A003|nr:GyrI-like domain-containing protein [Legionella genomosp. 1]